MKERSLITGSVGKTLLWFSIPFIISNTLQALYGAADLFVVGKFAEAASLSAVSIGSQIMQMVTSIVLGITTGATVLIGKHVGQGDDEGSAGSIGSSTLLFATIAVIITPIVLLLADTLVSVMQTPEAAISETRNYLMICGCGIPFIIGYNAISGIYTGLGDSKTPAVFISIACVINIVVDFVLVGGFGMKAEGAAIATVLAQSISFIIALVHIKIKGFPFPFGRRHIKLRKKYVKPILNVGFPLALQNVMVNVSFLVITAIINTMGLTQSAAVGVVEKLLGFFMLPIIAIASAVSTMTAQNIGAGQPKRAFSSLKFGIFYSLILATIICTFTQIAPQMFTAIFSSDAEVIAVAGEYLRSYSLDCLLVCFVFNMNSYFNGNGKAVVTVAHSLISTFAVRIPLSFYLSRIPDITLFEMGFAPPISTLLSIIICAFYFIWLKRSRTIDSTAK